VVPSHRTAILGGAWTALGFVPFDVWIGGAPQASAHLLGLLWMTVGVVFLWVPIRFLVTGRPIVDVHSRKPWTVVEAGSQSALVLRAITWVISASVFGAAFSMLALVLGHSEPVG
jgi:hypothetical protein